METLRFALQLLVELVPLFFLISTAVYLAVEALTPARIQLLLAHRSRWVGVPLAALLGAVTPFCSCSTVPLVHGMRRAGIPLMITLTFLIASPLINPVAVGLLWTMIGVSYAALYTSAALLIAMVGASIVARWYKEPAQAFITGRGALDPLSTDVKPSWHKRLINAARRSLGDLRKLWWALLLGVSIGALVHGMVPTGLLARIAGPHTLWAVPAAALLGLPVYASIVVLVPLGTALLAKGVGMGVVTAFLMGASGFSVPEGILLSRVLPRALLVRVLVVLAGAVVLVGYGLQWLEA